MYSPPFIFCKLTYLQNNATKKPIPLPKFPPEIRDMIFQYCNKSRRSAETPALIKALRGDPDCITKPSVGFTNRIAYDFDNLPLRAVKPCPNGPLSNVQMMRIS